MAKKKRRIPMVKVEIDVPRGINDLITALANVEKVPVKDWYTYLITSDLQALMNGDLLLDRQLAIRNHGLEGIIKLD